MYGRAENKLNKAVDVSRNLYFMLLPDAVCKVFGINLSLTKCIPSSRSIDWLVHVLYGFVESVP
jgi:hypothetical protein